MMHQERSLGEEEQGANEAIRDEKEGRKNSEKDRIGMKCLE
jgi:hypothetical protein